MADTNTTYVRDLAEQLRERYPDLLAAEKDLALLRARLAIVATWLHNPTHCADARRALAQDLNLPEPAPLQRRPS